MRNLVCAKFITLLCIFAPATNVLLAQSPVPETSKPADITVPATVTPEPPKTESTRTDFEFGKGMTVTSANGKSTMNIRFRFQQRFTQTEVPADQTSEITEFQTRRARLAIRGQALGKDWKYYIQFGFSNLDMEKDRPVPLRNAELSYERFRDIKITMGQMKTPYNRQRIISSGAQQFVERSISNNELNTDRDVGVMLSSPDLLGLNLFSYSAGVYGGDGRNRTASTGGVMTVGKISVLPFGVFKDSSEVDFSRSTKPLVKLTGMGGINKNSNRKLSTFGDLYEFSQFDFEHYGAEALIFWYGFSLSAEYLERHADTAYREKLISAVLKREYSRSARGGMIQLAYLAPMGVEFGLRYSEYRPIGNTDPSLTFSVERGGAVSYYLHEHNLKFQTDYTYVTGEVAAKAEAHQFRLQLQVFI